MKKIIKNTLLMLITVILIASCTKDNELLFNEDNLVYVDEFKDSTDYSFAAAPESVISDSILVNFRIIGTASAKDREIKLAPTANSTAKVGYHYKVGKALIKAGQFSARIPIYLYRKPGLKDSTLLLILNIVESQDFKPGFPRDIRYKITLNDVLNKPTNWETSWAPFFGSYSQVKFKFLIAVTGKSNWNSPPLPQDSRYLSQKARNALLEYNQQYGAMIDENGAEVFFP